MTVTKHMPYNTVNFRKMVTEWEDLTLARFDLLIDRVGNHCYRSITVGSPLTGAPGQPVKSSALLKSWRRLSQEDRRRVLIVSNLIYAPIIEDNWRGARLRSSVGGFHSVKMTKAAFPLIVAYELEIVKRSVPAPSGRGSQLRDRATGRFV